MLPVRRSDFIGILYDCILFEYANQMDPGESINIDLDDLAGAFDHVRQMYDDDYYDELLKIPSDLYINKQGLDDPGYLNDYIQSLEGGAYAHFPYNVDVYDGEPTMESDDEDNDYYSEYTFDDYDRDEYGRRARTDCYGDEVPYNDDECDYGDNYIILRGFRGQEVQDFLKWYADDVPSNYHDEIAALIQGLRDDYWENRGSGGTWTTLPNGMRGATKFSEQHNTTKRERTAQQQRDGEEVERRRREREEEDRLQVARRQEQERLRREEQERLLREQREREEREEALRQIYSRITQYMCSLQTSLASSQHRDDEVESLRQALQDELQDYYDDGDIEVHLFGSFASGLSSKTSDADFTVYYFNHGNIVGLADALHYIGYRNVSSITNARVPIATFHDPDNGINCDINIGEPMGVINSKLINTYRQVDNRMTSLWFAVRQLAKKNGILSGSTGYLSSYALTMMVIVFLQAVANPAILPRLQQQAPHRMVYQDVEGYDCSFDRNWSNHRTYGSDNLQTAGQLLVNFCQYFGYTFDYAAQEINSCLGQIKYRSVTPPARSRRDRRPKDWPICILDPFITDRNVAGNCRRDAVGEIQRCFRSAYDALKDGNIDKAFKR